MPAKYKDLWLDFTASDFQSTAALIAQSNVLLGSHQTQEGFLSPFFFEDI